MRENETIILTRDCPGIQIPAGDPISLAHGATVIITQSLGGNYTVMTDRGELVRIAARDADALGKKVDANLAADEDLSIEERVWEQLKTCYDPEIPVNIVDLGLIYGCEVVPSESGGYRVEVQMTLTAPGCGMGPVLQADAESKIKMVPGVKEANVEVVFDPPWDQSRMSEAARLQLNL